MAAFASQLQSYASYSSLFFDHSSVFISDDFSAIYLWKVVSPEVNFRLIYDRHKEGHYYTRSDYKTPAIVVNQKRNTDDIVISACRPSFYYLDHLDYLFVDLTELNKARGHLCQGRPINE